MPRLRDKLKKFAKSNESELSSTTSDSSGRAFNFATIERRTRRVLAPQEALKRAKRKGILGKGFPSVDTAVKSAAKRSRSLGEGGQLLKAGANVRLKSPEKGGGVEFFAPQVTGGRVRRESQQSLGRTAAFNPGGKRPTGGGGQPKPVERRGRPVPQHPGKTTRKKSVTKVLRKLKKRGSKKKPSRKRPAPK